VQFQDKFQSFEVRYGINLLIEPIVKIIRMLVMSK
jgi:hypothetical protein